MTDSETIISKITGGRQPDRSVDLRASLFYSLKEDPFGLWCRYHAPPSEAIEERSGYSLMKSELVHTMRSNWIKENFPEAMDTKPLSGLEGLKYTVKAMLDGVPAIIHAVLWNLPDNTYGTAALIVRDDTHHSDLGAFHYRVIDFKSASDIKPQHELQGALYNRMLGNIQGYTPERFTIILRNFAEVTLNYETVSARLDETLKLWRSIRDGSFIPEPGRPPLAALPPWRKFANDYAFQKKELVLIPGMGPENRNKLRQNGLTDTDLVLKAGKEKLCEILDKQPGLDAYGSAFSYSTNSPVLREGRSYQITRAERNLYFDFETSDDMNPDQPPHTYLIGLWDLEQNKYVYFLARGAEEEKKIFSSFLEYAGDLSNTKLYHWTDYEIRQTRGFGKKYPELSEGFEKLISSCVDIKDIVKKSFYVPAPSFSLKAVAPAIGFHWRQKDVGAMESMIYYWDWLKDNNNTEALDKVLKYNEDDCLAMVHIDQYLTLKFPA